MVSILPWTRPTKLRTVGLTLHPPIKHAHFATSRQLACILRRLAGNCDECGNVGETKKLYSLSIDKNVVVAGLGGLDHYCDHFTEEYFHLPG